jgi:hypothetical protein
MNIDSYECLGSDQAIYIPRRPRLANRELGFSVIHDPMITVESVFALLGWIIEHHLF